jgi:hypothetical protein
MSLLVQLQCANDVNQHFANIPAFGTGDQRQSAALATVSGAQSTYFITTSDLSCNFLRAFYTWTGGGSLIIQEFRRSKQQLP